METTPENSSTSGIPDHLGLLESRISRIEERLGLEPLEAEEVSLPSPAPDAAPETDSLEFRIGQYWLSQAGIVVLVVGIAFLLTFPYRHVPPALPVVSGYGLVALMVGLSFAMRKSFRHIALCLVGGALFVLYFATLRLHFFTPEPVVSNRNLVLALLAGVVVANVITSVRFQSPYFTALSLVLGYATAIICGGSHFLFTGVLLMSGLAVFLGLRFQWGPLILISILLTYSCHAVWAINNPLLGRPLEFVTSPRSNLLFLLAYGIIFAAGVLLRKNRDHESDLDIVNSLLNCAACYVLFLTLSIAAYRSDAAPPNLLASAVFLSVAILFWRREHSRYATFFYAMVGYAALTVAIVSLAGRPEVFMWLCWQSLLVVATAVWFRSKFIVLANFFIFVGILMAYVTMTEQIGPMSLSFGAVALISARILKWKKHRLELRTEFLRTVYLLSAFLIFPYALWHLVPPRYVSLSWMAVALVYYVLSIALKNIKYRWMALLTLLLTVLHLFVVGLAQFDPAYRIVSFIVLGLVLLGVSLVYTRIRTRDP